MPSNNVARPAAPKNFTNDHAMEIWIVVFGALAIVVFLSAAFYLYDANRLEGPVPAAAVQEIEQQQPTGNPDDLIASMQTPYRCHN